MPNSEEDFSALAQIISSAFGILFAGSSQNRAQLAQMHADCLDLCRSLSAAGDQLRLRVPPGTVLLLHEVSECIRLEAERLDMRQQDAEEAAIKSLDTAANNRWPL